MDEVERRIEEARAKQEREKQTKEFLESLTSNDELVRAIHNPEAFAMREKAKGAANRGELPRTECRHPLSYLRQFIDEDSSVKRRSRPVNLFECGVCHTPLWLVDPWGGVVSDD